MKMPGILIPDVEALFQSTLRRILRDGDDDSWNNLTPEERNRFIEAFDEKFVNYFQKRASAAYLSVVKSSLKNQKRLSNIHKDTFKHFCGYIKLCSDLFRNMRRRVTALADSNNNKIVISSYGYLIRLSDQIFVMLMNGYPDGALRIWRSLYEYTAVLLLLMKEYDNNELFSKYINHQHRNKAKKIQSYLKHFEKLNFQKLDDELLKDVFSATKVYEQEYGKEFLVNEYGWAATLFSNNKRPTLRDIEDMVDLTRLRPFYIWASAYSHATFESMYDFIEKEQTIFLAKITEPTPEKQSIIDPLQLTLSLLHQVNGSFLQIYCVEHEYEINLKLFRRVFEMMQNSL